MPKGNQKWVELLGESDPMLRLKDTVQRVAPTDCTVLITGETGSGKEVVANYIHSLSPRAAKPLVCVNCSALPDTLIESELFGYERGAFTGAMTQQEGMLRQADGSTIFLDEIGDMSLMAQAKVLRAIDAREVQPLGGKKTARIDVRIVAATHRDLRQLVSQGEFREDLFFRLCVVPLHIPPLRERSADIPALIQRFIQDLNVEHRRNIEGVSASGLKFLMAHDWPGNVRQLRNALERAFIICSSNSLCAEDFQFLRFRTESTKSNHLTFMTFRDARTVTTSDEVRSALMATRWNKSKAAQLLKTSRMNLYRQMAKYGIDKQPNTASAAANEGSVEIRQSLTA